MTNPANRQSCIDGCRAPLGYRLKSIDTGTIRDGAPVLKSVLELDATAPLVARYLKERAKGLPRAKLLREMGVRWLPNGLVTVEWNALTYAGHTVWNRHAGEGAGRKLRPRTEWIIQRDTHPALITDAEAETLIHRLQTSTLAESIRAAKQGISQYLLTGLLHTPDGRAWEGWRGIRYRLKPSGDQKGRYIDRQSIDDAVRTQILSDLRTPALVADLTRAAQQATARDEPDPAADLRAESSRLAEQISRAMDLALSLADPGPAVRKINDLEARRTATMMEIDRIERETISRAMLETLTEARVAAILDGIASDLDHTPSDRWKSILHTLIARVDLDPATLACQIRYRVAVDPPVDTLNLASPRGCPGWGIEATRYLRWSNSLPSSRTTPGLAA